MNDSSMHGLSAKTSLEAEMSLPEACRILGFERHALQKYVLEGKILARNAALPGHRTRWRIPVSEVLKIRTPYCFQVPPQPASVDTP